MLKIIISQFLLKQTKSQAAELTMTLGQAFQMAYRRYCDNEKADLKRNKEMIDIGNEIEKMKTENVHLREKLNGGGSIDKPDVEQKPNNETKTNKTKEAKTSHVRFLIKYSLCLYFL